jgi:polar amino acid transport system substrate-binding protein
MKRALKITLPILIVLLLAVSGFACWSIYQLITTIRYQNRSLAIQAKLNNLNGLLQDAETAGEATLLLGNENHRFGYSISIERIPLRLKELKNLIKGNQKQLETFSQIEGIVLDRVQSLAEQIQAEPLDRGQFEQALREFRKGLVLNHMIQKGFQEMDLREAIELNSHEHDVKFYSDSAIQLIAFGTVLTIALILLFAFMSQNEIHRRNRLLEDLSQAREAATVASKLKSQFLATVSHEIRTPLNGIIGFSDLLRNRVRDPEQKNMVALIHESGENLLKIVNDILDFSKIEAGKLDFEISDFSISQVTATIVELMSLKARQKNLTVLSYIDGQVPPALRGDSSRLAQVLQNLLSNALKFTERDGVFIRIFARGVRDNGELLVRFEVQDTGVGISVENQKILFQPFNQLNRSEGTGLGLSICKNLVEQMNGRIGVESNPNSGSTFWFELPFVISSEEQVEAEIPVELVNSGKKIKIFSKSITVKKTLQSYFREWGIPVDFIEETSALVQDNHFMIVDGLRWTPNEIQEHLRKQPTSLILVGGWEGRDFEDGQADKNTLNVPFSRDQLVGAIERVFGPDTNFEEAAVEIPAAKSQPRPAVPRRSGLILLAEDNPVNQALAEMHIERLGYKVHSVANGKEALEAVANIEYGLVLMDIQMPQMDGMEATRRIREQENKTGHHIPIVAMTANAIPGDREKYLAAGMDEYISKPFKEQELARILNELMGADASEMIDWNVLRELSIKTSPDTVRKLILSFISTLRRNLELLEVQIANQEIEQIRFCAHQLKSSCESLGALGLAELCRQVETMVEAQAPDTDILHLADELMVLGQQVLDEFLEREYFTSTGT